MEEELAEPQGPREARFLKRTQRLSKEVERIHKDVGEWIRAIDAGVLPSLFEDQVVAWGREVVGTNPFRFVQRFVEQVVSNHAHYGTRDTVPCTVNYSPIGSVSDCSIRCFLGETSGNAGFYCAT